MMAAVSLSGMRTAVGHHPEWVVNARTPGRLDFKLKCPNCRATFYKGSFDWTQAAESSPRPWDIRDTLGRWEKKARPYVESFPCEQGV